MSYTYGTYFDTNQYIEIAKKAAQAYLELEKSKFLPLKITEKPDIDNYRHLLVTEGTTGGAVVDWSEYGEAAEAEHGYKDYFLPGKEHRIRIKNKEISRFGEQLIADKKEAGLRKWADEVDTGIFQGFYSKDGTVLLANGYMAQATEVEDLNGTDSNLSTKGDIWKGFKKMIETVPFEMRESNSPIIAFVSENLANKAHDPGRIYNDKIEYDFIVEQFLESSQYSQKGAQLAQIIVTNKILIPGTDTKGTHDRILLVVPNKELNARVISRGFSLIGEEKQITGIRQLWGWRGRGCVFDANSVLKSEQIVWA